MNTEAMYATMRSWPLFFKVALPSMFAMSVYSIVEGLFIGRTLGEGAFAAVLSVILLRRPAREIRKKESEKSA